MTELPIVSIREVGPRDGSRTRTHPHHAGTLDALSRPGTADRGGSFSTEGDPQMADADGVQRHQGRRGALPARCRTPGAQQPAAGFTEIEVVPASDTRNRRNVNAPPRSRDDTPN
jgi:hypothetical protein